MTADKNTHPQSRQSFSELVLKYFTSLDANSKAPIKIGKTYNYVSFFKEDYKNTWEAKILKKLEDNQAAWWSSQGLTPEGYDALCDDGRKYAAEKNLTFICQLL